MTKCLVLTLFLFLGAYSVKSASINQERESKVDGVKEFFKRKCFKNANIESLNELKLEIQSIALCNRDSFSRPRSQNEFYNSVCATSKNYKCLAKIQEKIEPCLDSEEKYLKDYILSTYNASIDYFCKDGEKAFEDKIGNLMLSIVSCSKWQELLEFETNASCLKEINLEFSNNPDLVVTKSYLCSKLEEAAECLLDGFKKRCKDDTVPNFTREGMQLLLNWCVEND